MFVKKIKININTLSENTTATTVNIPIRLDYQFVGQTEEIEGNFTVNEVNKATNPILDYDKVRCTPIDSNNIILDTIRYNVDLTGSTTYGAIGFTDDDIKFRKEYFKQTFLNLNFYDTDNPLTQSLISTITLFSQLRSIDYNQIGSGGPMGTVKPASLISLNFDIENQITRPLGVSEGYYIYNYKGDFNVSNPKYLYMKATFKNSKTGLSTNLTTNKNKDSIDNIINKHQLYTRYNLIHTSIGYFYSIDNTYSNNVKYNSDNDVTTNDVTVNLYQIQVN